MEIGDEVVMPRPAPFDDTDQIADGCLERDLLPHFSANRVPERLPWLDSSTRQRPTPRFGRSPPPDKQEVAPTLNHGTGGDDDRDGHPSRRR